MTLCNECEVRHRGFKRFAPIVMLMTGISVIHHTDFLA